jgi:hypothetical protein
MWKFFGDTKFLRFYKLTEPVAKASERLGLVLKI